MSFDTWENELYHHGIKGQKWGVRRFQNEDGSLTPAGRKRYGSVENLNYIKKGDIVEKTYGREKRRFERKAEKTNAKLQKVLTKDDGKESSKSKRLARKCQIYADSAKFRKDMLKTYSKMAESDRRKIKAGLHASNALWAAGHVIPFAVLAGSLALTYSTGKLVGATDSKNGLARYENTSLFRDKIRRPYR